MPLVMNLACISMRLTPAEVLVAATINATCAIQMEDRVGSLEVGKQGDIVMWNVSSYQELHILAWSVDHVGMVLGKRDPQLQVNVYA